MESFQTAQTYASGGIEDEDFVAVADFNGDKKLDVAAASSSRRWLLHYKAVSLASFSATAMALSKAR